METNAPPHPGKARPFVLAAYATFALGLAAVAAASAYAFLAGEGQAPLVKGRTISQSDRRFAPALLQVAVGDTVTIVNDDGTTVHHAYVPEDGIDFDSGDQEPGARASVTFDRPGTFRVLCGIHPRMQSVVEVRRAERAGTGNGDAR